MAVVSSHNAWAVGYDRHGALIEHWDGRAWSVEASLSTGSESGLLGVAATSSRNACAVGYTHTPGRTATLAVHCG